MRIIFLGTPDFAVPPLQSLYDNGYEIVGVVTQPDKPRNRGEVLPCAVKQKALELGLNVMSFDKIKVDGYDALQQLNADIMITCAYGQIISQQIIDMTPFGVINIHASLLPKYRGSSPIQWCLLNGEKTTGITLMKTALGIDSGDILLQKPMEISYKMTSQQLFDELSNLGAKAIIEGLELLKSGKAQFVAQDHSQATHFPMLSKSDGLIDWQQDGQSIFNKIYAFNPFPSAYTFIDGKMLKIWDVDIINTVIDMPVGSVIKIASDYCVVCKDCTLKLLEIQLEGKKKMHTQDYVNGNKLDGQRLGNNE